MTAMESIPASASPREYDVAISFVARDEPLARQIANRLGDAGLDVFFFPRRQEELVGTDGMVSMREPFLNARVAVVLFQHPWGQTPWTGVEQQAILDRCLKQGWHSFVFVRLEDKSALPKWLPDTHVYFSMSGYSPDELIGAIKARVQERGGRVQPLDAMAVAKRVRRETQHAELRQSLIRDRRWIEDRVHRDVQRAVDEVVTLAQKAQDQHGLQIAATSSKLCCGLRWEYVSMDVSWHQPIYNLVGDHPTHGECCLAAAEFSGHVPLPGQAAVWYVQQPRALKRHKFKVDVDPDGGTVWRQVGSKDTIPGDQLADRLMMLFLELVSRASQGKIEPPLL